MVLDKDSICRVALIVAVPAGSIATKRLGAAGNPQQLLTPASTYAGGSCTHRTLGSTTPCSGNSPIAAALLTSISCASASWPSSPGCCSSCSCCCCSACCCRSAARSSTCCHCTGCCPAALSSPGTPTSWRPSTSRPLTKPARSGFCVATTKAPERTLWQPLRFSSSKCGRAARVCTWGHMRCQRKSGPARICRNPQAVSVAAMDVISRGPVWSAVHHQRVPLRNIPPTLESYCYVWQGISSPAAARCL